MSHLLINSENHNNMKESFDIVSNASLMDFLNDEKICDKSIDSIFSEINRLSSLNSSKIDEHEDERTIEEILKEAETLINQPIVNELQVTQTISAQSTPYEMRNKIIDEFDYSTKTAINLDDDLSERTLQNSQLDSFDSCPSSPDTVSSMKSKKSSKSSGSKKSIKKKSLDKIEPFELPSTSPEIQTEKENDEKFDFHEKILCDKSTAPSPTHSMSSSVSFSWARERELENTNEQLNEHMKDTEERFQSLKIQYESLSQTHRAIRENHMQLQDETDKLKIDFQLLTECANVIRSELQSSKSDRESAHEVNRILQTELDANRVDKKKFQEVAERDSRIIQDLQRQCREMERILMRKHPDSVSALIVASKNSNNSGDTSASTRKLLEQRIAQLEADAKEQDKKAQGILANVQARFKNVQSKYENHIQDLETQVLSLQQINLEQSKELLMQNQMQAAGLLNLSQATQTLDVPEKEVKSRTIAIQTDLKSTPTSRASSASSITAKKNPKLPNSHSDTALGKDDAHLLATIRGMRVELAIKEKAVQRLTRDLEECKKTIRKLQKERDNYLKPDKSNALTPKKTYNPAHYSENSETQVLKDKIKVLEMEFKGLYEKRVQDLKCLQGAHERELSACHETIRIIQSRLEERDMNPKEKRRGPIDYYALKAKVTSLERRHSEREKSLHLLIDALSKGQISGLQHGSGGTPENYDSMSPHSNCNSPVTKNL